MPEPSTCWHFHDNRRWRIGRAFSFILAVAPLLAPARRATAADTAIQVVTEITPAELKRLMAEEGYAVSIDDDGVITWKLDGFRTSMFTADDRQAIQFHASFSDGNATLKKVNEWNGSKRFSRTYLDDDGDPHLELDLDLDGGVTINRILTFLRTSKASFAAWCKEVVE